MTTRCLWLSLAAILLAGMGCSTGTAVSPEGDAKDVPGAESRIPGDAGDTVTDVHIRKPDLLADQASEGKWELPDWFQPDKLVPDEKPQCDAAPYPFGCTCTQNSDCLSGFCVEGPDGKVCTMNCVDECPQGWSCAQVPGSCPDCQFVCISRWLDLCRPCMSNPECQQGGFTSGNLCVNWGAEGLFCATGCTTSQDCPNGFSCLEVEVKGGTSLLCMPTTDECVCTPHFQSVQAQTACFVENDLGKCLGERYCGEDGLTACDAATPEKEICDGKDNDCDGMKDEDADICSGGKQCKCAGQDCSCQCPDGLFDCEDGTCIDILSSVAHCGQCNQPCIADNVETYTCQGGICKIVKCMAGFENFDTEYPNGCECPILPELCDGKDNDCDGAVDEGEETCPGKGDCKGTCVEGICQCSAGCDYCSGMCVPLEDYFGDPMNCGYCGNKCALDNTAVHGCEGGNCTPITCKNGFANCNLQPGDGCEWTVIQEMCNCVDDDCDGEIDEQPMSDCAPPKICEGCFCQCPKDDPNVMDCGDAGCKNVATDPANCGWCGNDCSTMGWPDVKQYGCTDKNCAILGCQPDFFDTNKMPWDGCECKKTANIELCDMVDNNCDGQVDEDPLSDCKPPKKCQWGTCACPMDQPNLQECEPDKCIDTNTVPTHCGFCGNVCALPNVTFQKCEGGQCVVSACKPGFKDCNELPFDGCEFEVKPEECNGFDDDCDKETDEGAIGIGQPCDSGLPGLCQPGVQQCTNGALNCKPNIAPNQFNEVCDNKDNNCDAQIDENNPGGGGPCTVQGLKGECKLGALECINGTLTCQQTVFPQPEECDGKDNDCDGVVDGMEEDCFTMCGNGKKKCNGGIWGVCSAMAPKNCKNWTTCVMEDMCVLSCPTAPTEQCNSMDDNCDGKIDEIFACQVGQVKSQKCGNCGTQNSSCTGACTWGPWELCQGEGVCSPGQSKVEGTCGNCGQQQYTCNASCQWQPSTCLNQGICSPGSSKTEGSCGKCGKYQYSCSGSCQWVQGACTGEGVCSVGQTKTEGTCGNCGQQQYSCSASCQWQTSTCLNQGICKAGSTKYEGSCGNCGQYLYTCSGSCAWVQGSCSNQGVCKPGEKKACDACKAQVCSASCQWGTCGSGNMCGSIGSGGCGCDPACVTYGDCCGGSGASSACKVCNYGCYSCESDTECQGSGGNCYCDDACITFNDCCNNARGACGTQTCQNACGQDLGSGCDCDWNCGWPTQGPCCADKGALCG